MFKNVLVGVDGGPGGQDAIALAQTLANPDARITLVHVYSGALRPSHAISPAVVREEREASVKLLQEESATADLGAALVSFEALSPGEGLHVQAEEQGADLLVVGSSSRGTFGRAWLGDDTRAALNDAPCAVAVASRGYAERPVPIGKVGVAYNRSPESRAALVFARELAAETEATVRALEVVSIPVYGFGLIPPVTEETIDLSTAEADEHMKGLPNAEGRAVYGLATEELARFGDEVDVLVVGSRGFGPLRRVVHGSTSNYLQRHARCSLLILPRGGAAPAGDGETDALHSHVVPA